MILFRILFFAIKFSYFILSVFIYLLSGTLAHFLIKDFYLKHNLTSQILHYLSKLGLVIFNVKVKSINYDKHTLKPPLLVVSNHVGFLDVLIIVAKTPCLFVTSYEIKETPFLGWLTDAAGCLYVERRNRGNIHNEVGNIRNALNLGLNVVLFPEATSSNGCQVLPFKKSMFVAAANSKALILPITLNYTQIDKRPVTSSNKDYAFWYGDQSFFPALIKLFSNFSIDVELTYSEKLKMNHADDRTPVSIRAHELISSNYRPILD